jgi:hypothetical protein
MAPFLRPGGSVAIECDAAVEIHAGDIIVFHEGGTLTAHWLLFRLRLGRCSFLYQAGNGGGVGHWIREKQLVGVVLSSTDAEGTLLYERRTHGPADRRGVTARVIRDARARVKQAIRAATRGSRGR